MLRRMNRLGIDLPFDEVCLRKWNQTIWANSAPQFNFKVILFN